MITEIIGSTVQSLAICSHSFNVDKLEAKKMMIIGGVHGDEIEGVALCSYLLNRWAKVCPFDTQLMLIPALNLDGVLLQQRKNSRGIDLNRNLPTKDWTSDVANERYFPGTVAGSEPENQALIAAIHSFSPQFIISIHSFEKYLLNVNGNCEPIASFLNRETSYPIEESMGYPTPGCLGTYSGLEKGIPTITYELKRGQDLESLVPLHAMAIEAAILDWEKQ